MKSTSTLVMMNPVKALLQENGVDSPVRVLKLDGVTSEQIFHWLKLQYMAQLLEREGMQVGAHEFHFDLCGENHYSVTQIQT